MTMELLYWWILTLACTAQLHIILTNNEIIIAWKLAYFPLFVKFRIRWYVDLLQLFHFGWKSDEF